MRTTDPSDTLAGGGAPRADDGPDAIRTLMEESRSHVRVSGRYWVLWGVVTVLGLSATYVVAGLRYPLPVGLRAVWGGLIVIGWGSSFWMGWMDQTLPAVSNEVTRIVGSVWIGLGVALTGIALAGIRTEMVGLSALPGLLALIVGAGVFATGFIQGLGWLRAVAVGWWLSGTAMLAIPGEHNLIVLAITILLFQILPGAFLELGGRRRGERRPVSPRS